MRDPDPGRLGASVDANGATFAVYSREATAIDVCVLDRHGSERRLALEPAGGWVWRRHVRGLGHGSRYGLRASGPLAPERGLRFDPEHLLVDPYARAVDGDWSVVVDSPFDWGDDRHPDTAWTDTVIYEAHVRGLTRRHPAVPAPLRGTYAGLAHPAVIDGLARLGVTAVELLPVQEHRTEAVVAARGLANYWGYSPVAFFAPHGAYSASGARGGQLNEFRSLVRTLHAAGIEVLLDVVYNHTGEGRPGDPPHSLRGLDNRSYYWLDEHDPSRQVDVTGCGNTLDPESCAVQRLVLQSLRYWVEELHVDGFRFDLAVVLGRLRSGFDASAPLLKAIQADPVLRSRKLIAEPWDLGDAGYRLGGFPPPFAEWNGAFRDDVRDSWRGQGSLRALARRLSGSEDVFAPSGRGSWASVNYVTSHDGATLTDLVTYERPRNEANREGGTGGPTDGRAWNGGAEGPSDDPELAAQRRRRARGMLTTVLAAAGVPMLLAGDERARTQLGNTNAYCQDNEVSWLDWSDEPEAAETTRFVARLAALRRNEPLLRRSEHLTSRDVAWLGADGSELDEGGWHDPAAGVLQMSLSGESGDAELLLAFVLGAAADVTLPPGTFSPLVDTEAPDGAPAADAVAGTIRRQAWSVLVLRRIYD